MVCNQQVGDFVAAAIRVAIVDGVAFINRMPPRRWV
jgi:arginine N-succinyltransferase